MKFNLKSTMFCFIISMLMFSGCMNNGAVGSKSNPIKFYFMPLKDKTISEVNIDILKSYVEENSGFYVKTYEAKDFLSIIKGFGKNKVDVAFMNTLGYLLAHDWAGAVAGLKTLYGDGFESYKGEILVRSDSGISELSDLNGKTVAFADLYSASGYLYPLKLLKDNNIKPSKTVFADGHLNAIGMLYDGSVDVIATYHTKPTIDGVERDARVDLIKQHPDVLKEIKVLALTEEIPNGPIAFRKDLPEAVRLKLMETILKFSKTDDGRKALNELYNITGLATANDSDYDLVRNTLKQTSKTIQEMIPGGEPYFKAYIVPGLE